MMLGDSSEISRYVSSAAADQANVCAEAEG
jgi:hypothetical protein